MTALKRTALLIILAGLFQTSFCLAAANQNLKSKLLAMAKRDQAVRKVFPGMKGKKPPQQALDKMHQVDQDNRKALEAIIQQYGWPNKALVDEDGVQAAFLIVQHVEDVKFQQQMLPSIEQSWRNNEGVTGQEFALLSDRVLVKLGKPQKYGTQIKSISEKGVVFYPIENKENIDQRRQELKMPPLDFYRRLMEEMAGLKDYPDIDLEK